MTQIKWFMIVVLACLSACDAYKILVMFPLPGKSHSLLGDGHVRLLLEAGHEVTYITSFPKNNTHPNLHQIDVSSVLDVLTEDTISIEKIMNKETNLNDIRNTFKIFTEMNENLYKNDNLQSFLNDPNQIFDVIIIEWLFSDIASGISAVYGSPYIWFISVDPNWMASSLVDEATNPAYNGDIISGNVPPFTFIQRIQELFSQIASAVFKNFLISSSENKIYQDAFGPIMAKKGKTLPPLDIVKYNASLMLVNAHVSLGQTMRLPQICKPIAGFHIERNVKPLPQDLQKLMDNAPNGIIYFSMGSSFKSKHMPLEIKNGLLKMFGGLKQTVIWKFEDKLNNLPDNVHILQWAPQHSILSHPNCVLFITHGGFLSSTETVHFGVPIIGVPIAADQFRNVKRAVQLGIGKEVTLSYSMADDLKIAIEDVINNPIYREKAKELSLVYHDRVAPPAAELVHWVEHVVRTRGAPHLRSPALLVPWYQKFYLDLFALILAGLFIVKIAINRIFSSNKKQKKDKKNN